MEYINIIFSNGFIFIAPILVWNLIFTKRLPKPYGTDEFDAGISKPILIGENSLRIIVFLIPLFIKVNQNELLNDVGFSIYMAGLLLYFMSWIMLISFRNSKWSLSLWGFTAPAYLPIIWFVGLAICGDSYYCNITYSSWHLIIPAIFFSIFHITHTVTVYREQIK